MAVKNRSQLGHTVPALCPVDGLLQCLDALRTHDPIGEVAELLAQLFLAIRALKVTTRALAAMGRLAPVLQHQCHPGGLLLWEGCR